MEHKKFWSNRTSLEKILLCCVFVMCLAVLIIFISILSSSDSGVCTSPQCVNAAMHIMDHIDPTIDPCDNFYKFACGNFLKNGYLRKKPTPLAILTDITKNKLKEIITETRDEKELPHSLVMQRKFYRSCLNTTKGKENEEVLLELLDQAFGGWPAVMSYSWNENDFQWFKAVTKARSLGLHFKSLLVVGVFSKDLGENMILWLKSPSRKNVLRYHWKKEHVDVMVEIATLLGAKSISVTSEIRRTVDFAQQLQEIIEKYTYNTTNESRKDVDYDDPRDNIYLEDEEIKYNKTINDINLVFMQINWLDFLRNITSVKVQKDTKIWFGLENYLQDLYHLLIRTPKRILANYMVWNVIVENIAFLSDEIIDKYKNILRAENETLLTREELCINLSRKLYRNAVEAEYIRRTTTAEKKKYILEMIGYISRELKLSQQASTWMNEQDRNDAIKRVDNIKTFIGWTDIVFDIAKYEKMFGYDRLESKDNIVDMARLANKVRNDRFYEQVMENITEIDLMFDSPKLDINAYYIKLLNKLILPAPILQNHIFDLERPHYMNYGALGTVIGHEYTHGFSGWFFYNFDELYDIWQNDTVHQFQERAQCIMDEYENYLLENSGKKDNDTSFEENHADFYGLQLANRAYQKWVRAHGPEQSLPGIKYTPNQIFWIMASTYMCTDPNYLDKDKKHNSKNFHGMPSFRVIGRLRSSYAFAKDFKCSQGTYMNPKKKCGIYV